MNKRNTESNALEHYCILHHRFDKSLHWGQANLLKMAQKMDENGTGTYNVRTP